MSQSTHQYSLLWICNSDLTKIMDASTWLSVTKEIRNMGWKVTLITIGDPGEKTIKGVGAFGISAPKVYLLGKIIYMIKLIFYIIKNGAQYDFILFHHRDSPAMVIPRLIHILFRRKNRPLYVLDSRSLSMSVEKDVRFKDRIRYLYNDTFDKWGHVLFDGRTAITKRITEVIGIPWKKLWGIWPSGVVLEEFTSSICERHFPVDDDPIDLIYIGTLDEVRNLRSLALAVNKANEEGMNFGLTLIGEGNDKEYLRKMAENSRGKVRVFNHVEHVEIPGWLARSHVGVLPFPNRVIFQVSSPIKLFEYMASGMPIFATRIACHTDVIGDGTYAFWAEDSDVDGLYSGLRTIWENKDQLTRMSEKSKEAADNWTWKAAAIKLSTALIFGKELYSQKHSNKA